MKLRKYYEKTKKNILDFYADDDSIDHGSARIDLSCGTT